MRKYFVTDKQLKYLAKEGYKKEFRIRALNELLRRKAERKNYIQRLKS